MRALDRRRLIFVVVVSGVVLAACTGGSSTGGGPTSTLSGGSGTAAGSTAAPSGAPSVGPSSVPVPTPSPSASPTPAGGGTSGPASAPPKPSHTTYVLVKETVSSDQITITERYRATWTEPAGVAAGFRVYGVTSCIRESKKNDDTPCVVPGMQIPPSKLELLATAPGDARSVDVTWTRTDEEGPDPYWAILLSAVNPHGESRSAILTSAQVCYQCVY